MLTQENNDSILNGLDGRPHHGETIARAVRALDGSGTSSGTSTDDIILKIVEGSECKFPTSHSAVLVLGNKRIFLKKVTARAMQRKPWADRKRTLGFIRNEVRVYNEFRPALAEKGVRLPRVAMVEENLLPAFGDEGDRTDEPYEEELAGCGAILWLEAADGDALFQDSPLKESDALAALKGVAKLHAAAWGDRDLLQRAAQRLQAPGGSFALSIRNPKEIENLVGNWEGFMEHFAHLDPELFSHEGVKQLGTRLYRISGLVAARLSPAPENEHATLVHGDFKAMNVFLPRDDSDQQAMLIDFASMGVGFGAADVAMHLHHSVSPEVLDGGGEERLVDAYVQEVNDALTPSGEGQAAGVWQYPKELALCHYRHAVVDYGRFVIARFWTAANTTPDAFAKRACSKNTTLVNRNSAAALRFVWRIHECLRAIEEEVEKDVEHPAS